VVVPEAAHPRLAEVVPQFGHAEDLAGFLLDGVGSVLPDEFEDITDSPDDVVGVIRVIDEDAVPVNAEAIAFGGVAQGESVVTLEHTGRAYGERIERVGKLRGRAFPGGEPNVPTADDAAHHVRQQRGGERLALDSRTRIVAKFVVLSLGCFGRFSLQTRPVFHCPPILAVDTVEAKRDVVDFALVFGKLTIGIGDPDLPRGDPACEGFARNLQEGG